MTYPLAIFNLPSSSDESSDDEMIAFDTILVFCLELSPSSSEATDFLPPFLAPFPSPLGFLSRFLPRSPEAARLRPLPSPRSFLVFRSPVLRFLAGGPAPSLPLPRPPPEPSVTKPSSSSFFFRPYFSLISIKITSFNIFNLNQTFLPFSGFSLGISLN